MTLVAIDVGQSGTRAVRVGLDGERVHCAAGFATWLTGPRVAARVGRRLADMVERFDEPRSVDTVLVGLSGFDPTGQHATSVAHIVGERTGAHSVVVASDAVAWYLSAIHAGPGIVAAVGTGSVVLAADGAGACRQVDGWGHLLGDDGSGFAVGRAGLASALRSWDGRGGSSLLLDRLIHRYGSVAALTARIYASRLPSAAVAAFSTDVAACALDGDADAIAIWAEAGAAIGSAILAAHRAVFTPGQAVPVRVGGALSSVGVILMRSIRETVSETDGRLEIAVADVDSLAGVRRLGAEAAKAFPSLVVGWQRA